MAPPRRPSIYDIYAYNIYSPNCPRKEKGRKQDYLSRLKEEWLEKLHNMSEESGLSPNQKSNIFTVYSGKDRGHSIKHDVVIYRKHNKTLKPKDRSHSNKHPDINRKFDIKGVHVHVHRPKNKSGKKGLKPFSSTKGGRPSSCQSVTRKDDYVLFLNIPFSLNLVWMLSSYCSCRLLSV